MSRDHILPPIEKLLTHLDKGWTQTDIAQYYGVSRQAVSKKILWYIDEVGEDLISKQLKELYNKRRKRAKAS